MKNYFTTVLEEETLIEIINTLKEKKYVMRLILLDLKNNCQ